MNIDKKFNNLHNNLFKLLNNVKVLIDIPDIYKDVEVLSFNINRYAYGIELVLDNGYTVTLSSHGIRIMKGDNIISDVPELIRENNHLPAVQHRKLQHGVSYVKNHIKLCLSDFVFYSKYHVRDIIQNPNIQTEYKYRFNVLQNTSSTLLSF